MKNKNYIINNIFVMLLFFTISCHSQINDSYVITSVDKKQYSIFIKDSIFIKNDISFKNIYENRNGVNIKTKLKNILLKNNTSVDEDNDGYKKYEYLYYIKNHNKHLIKFTYFEGNHYLLIDDKSGKIDTLDSKPLIFGNRLLIIYQDMEDADQFSTLKYYIFNTKNNLNLINTRKERWVLKKATLLKNNNVAILVNSIQDNKVKYNKIVFKN